jgi:hypothetical protein
MITQAVNPATQQYTHQAPAIVGVKVRLQIVDILTLCSGLPPGRTVADGAIFHLSQITPIHKLFDKLRAQNKLRTGSCRFFFVVVGVDSFAHFSLQSAVK